jgi:hypothetical protein
MAARLRQVKQALETYKITLELPKGGSHWKMKSENGTHFSFPANGLKTEVSDAYIAKICRHFGINRREFCGRL